jgi:hypothetical protein
MGWCNVVPALSVLLAGRLRLTRSSVVPAAGLNRISMPTERFARVNNLLGLVE